MKTAQENYVGYHPQDYQTPYAKYFASTTVFKPSNDVAKALQQGSLPTGKLPAIEQAATLLQPGYAEVENGYTLEHDGSARLAIRTPMPNVTPLMWHWWFGWHGDQDAKYKLWHPQAHVSASWKDGVADKVAYIGRTSHIQEYIGKTLEKAAIQFVSPTSLGLTEATADQVFICARVGFVDFPLDYGWLIHQVRSVPGGAEMRSRFWLGGEQIKFKGDNLLSELASEVVQKVKRVAPQQAIDLVTHCSEEMSHLATFLPTLYAEFHSKEPQPIEQATKRDSTSSTSKPATSQFTLKGKVWQQNDVGFAARLEETLFNKRPLDRKPFLIVEPQDVDEIRATLAYAKSIGKRISVCSGGHSWSANHVRNDSILIIMKHFNSYEINKERMTAKAGPGVGGSVLVKALVKEDLFFPAGHCEGVCIGGYLLQGGFGWNGRKLGMACESVIGLDIVTADGELVHASATENADLYWAARGSGGGFFGVVVAFHLKLYRKPQYIGAITHVYGMEHLEEVFRWAADVGPSVPASIELQLLMSSKTVKFGKAGIEVAAPIFADDREEWEAAKQFMHQSSIKDKAYLKIPYVPYSMGMMYKFAMTHYPDDHCWSVDNLWTAAPIDELLPHLKQIADTLLPAPTHLLWLNWYPPKQRPEMAFSMEDNVYIALYSAWKEREATTTLEPWATDCIRRMEHLGTGIQLADENLNHRTARFVKDENLKKLEAVRQARDNDLLFNEWHSKPKLAEIE